MKEKHRGQRTSSNQDQSPAQGRNGRQHGNGHGSVDQGELVAEFDWQAHGGGSGPTTTGGNVQRGTRNDMAVTGGVQDTGLSDNQATNRVPDEAMRTSSTATQASAGRSDDGRASGNPGRFPGTQGEIGQQSMYEQQPDQQHQQQGQAQRGQGQIQQGTLQRSQGDIGHDESQHQTCRDVMTDTPACCVPSDTVDRPAKIMKSQDVGSVPVVDDLQHKRLIGILTDRDLAMDIVAEARDPRSVRVDEVMTRDPIVCHPDDDLQQALDAMARHQVRRIPVVDDIGRIVGIIAQADVAMYARAAEQTAAVVQEVSRPS